MDVIREYLRPELVWFLVGIFLLLLEFMLPGLIVFFFGFGACIVAAVCLFADISINAQLIIFIVSSVLSLLLLRSRLKGIFIGHVTSRQDITQNLEDFVGQGAVAVVKKIVPKMPGKVELHGTNWEAQADEQIEEGQAVKVIGKDNITLKVKRL